jgi:hypothetical protein
MALLKFFRGEIMANSIQNLRVEYMTFLDSEFPKAPQIRPLETPDHHIPLLNLYINRTIGPIGHRGFQPIEEFLSEEEWDSSDRRSPHATSENRFIPSRKDNTPPSIQIIKVVPFFPISKKQTTLRVKPQMLSDGTVECWKEKFGSGLAVAAFAPSSFNDSEICRNEEQAPFTLTRCARALVQVLQLKKRPEPKRYFVLGGKAKPQEVVPVAIGSNTNIINGFSAKQTSKSQGLGNEIIRQSLVGKPGLGRLFKINEEYSKSDSELESDSESEAEYPDFRINGQISLRASH